MAQTLRQSDALIRIAYMPDPVKELKEVGYPSPAMAQCLRDESGMAFDRISVEDLLQGCLQRGHYSILCVPGGFAPNTEYHLGSQGAQLIKDFVADGGGFVGVCAGAFLGSSLGFDLLPVQVHDYLQWERGDGPCALQFTAAGRHLLGTGSSPLTARYTNGPIFQINDPKVAFCLANFETEFWGKPVQHPMKGTPAVVCGAHGKGLVVLVSPHLEDSIDKATRAIFCNLFRLCSSFQNIAGSAQDVQHVMTEIMSEITTT